MPRLKSRLFFAINDFFAKTKETITNSFQENFRSPFSWRSILWDSYVGDEIPEKTMRFGRLIAAISFTFRFISATFLGLYLAIDGLYSIYRHRFELKLTKSWEEDVPRFARIMLGLLIVFNFYSLF